MIVTFLILYPLVLFPMALAVMCVMAQMVLAEKRLRLTLIPLGASGLAVLLGLWGTDASPGIAPLFFMGLALYGLYALGGSIVGSVLGAVLHWRKRRREEARS